nr:MAG TPA: hypothetical protein [Caudoviricetes sp.]
MKKENYTREEVVALVAGAKKKVQKILEVGLEDILDNPLADTPDYLHTKAVEQGQISIFLDSLQLHHSLKDICELEGVTATVNVLSKEETLKAKSAHDKYADIDNNLVSEVLVTMALELLTEDEVLEILLDVNV